jgi:hypothetical protein
MSTESIHRPPIDELETQDPAESPVETKETKHPETKESASAASVAVSRGGKKKKGKGQSAKPKKVSMQGSTVITRSRASRDSVWLPASPDKAKCMGHLRLCHVRRMVGMLHIDPASQSALIRLQALTFHRLRAAMRFIVLRLAGSKTKTIHAADVEDAIRAVGIPMVGARDIEVNHRSKKPADGAAPRGRPPSKEKLASVAEESGSMDTTPSS